MFYFLRENGVKKNSCKNFIMLYIINCNDYTYEKGTKGHFIYTWCMV